MNICCVKYIAGTMLLMFDVKAFPELFVSTLCLFCCLPVVCRSTLLNETDVALQADGLGSVSLIVKGLKQGFKVMVQRTGKTLFGRLVWTLNSEKVHNSRLQMQCLNKSWVGERYPELLPRGCEQGFREGFEARVWSRG